MAVGEGSKISVRKDITMLKEEAYGEGRGEQADLSSTQGGRRFGRNKTNERGIKNAIKKRHRKNPQERRGGINSLIL